MSLTGSALIASLGVRATPARRTRTSRVRSIPTGCCRGANRRRPSPREEKKPCAEPAWGSARAATARCAQHDAVSKLSPAFDEAPAGEVEYADEHGVGAALALALAYPMINYIAPGARTERKSMLQAPPPKAASCKNPPAIARFLRKWTIWLGSAKLV
jgi:hypothetical protein